MLYPSHHASGQSELVHHVMFYSYVLNNGQSYTRKELYIYVSDELRSSFETVLQYIGLTRLLPTRTSDDAVDTNDHRMGIDDEEEEEEGEYHSSHIIIGDETVEEVMNDELVPRDVE